jgi:predicted transcriptional regulator
MRVMRNHEWNRTREATKARAGRLVAACKLKVACELRRGLLFSHSQKKQQP